MPLINRPQFARSRRKLLKWKAWCQPATGQGWICRDMPLNFSLISGSGPIYHELGCIPGPSNLGAPSSGTHHHLSMIDRVHWLEFKRATWILIQGKMDPNSCNDYKWMVTHWITKTGTGSILNFPTGPFLHPFTQFFALFLPLTTWTPWINTCTYPRLLFYFLFLLGREMAKENLILVL